MGHYFIHQPFFRSKRLNDLFSIINMFSLLAPQALYQEHHLNHHTHNNRVVARDGVSQGDVSSVFFVNNGELTQRSLVFYVFAQGIWKHTAFYLKSAIKYKRGNNAKFELFIHILFNLSIILLIRNVWLFYVLPSTYFDFYFCVSLGIIVNMTALIRTTDNATP